MISDKELVDHIWHDKIEDKLSTWKYAAGILKLNLNIEISPQELKKRFQNFFEETMGIKPYTECPLCEKQLLPRKSKYGYFIGCSTYPNCKFIATSQKPWANKKEQNP